MNGTAELAVRNGSGLAQQRAAALAIRDGQTMWDEFQTAALNQLGLKNAGNGDRAVFLHQCQRTGLDPFAKQIMMIERREKQGDNWVSKWTIQTGIEGWRTIRDRAERREGLRGILSRFTYYDADDNERKVWTRAEPPAVIEVTYTVVEAGGREVPYTSQLRFDEYVQTKEGQNGTRYRIAQWAAKPVHMLEKCTEADVYRKAFPQDYSGVELTDAMPAPDPDAPPVQPERQRVTAGQVRRTVTAEVVTPDAASGDAPAPTPSPEAASSPDSRASAAQVARINGHGHRLGWGQSPDDLEGIVSAVNRWLRLDPPVRLDKLTSGQADDACAAMAKFDEGDAQGFLDLINDGVMPDGQ